MDQVLKPVEGELHKYYTKFCDIAALRPTIDHQWAYSESSHSAVQYCLS